jgi:hypothetical protein
MKLTEDQRKTVLDGARKGLSWATCAGLIGVSRQTLWLARKADPELDAGMARGLAQWDLELAEQEQELRLAEEFDDAEWLAKRRERRLPNRYSPDIKMRDEVESMVEDVENAPADTGGLDFAEALAFFLAAKKSGAL